MRYATEMERRSVDAGRAAERQLRLYREREKERQEALRELEERIALEAAALREKETESQRRLAQLNEAIGQREHRLSSLDAAVHAKEAEWSRTLREATDGVEEAACIQTRIRALSVQEREAKERLILAQTRRDMQRKEWEAESKAIQRRSNSIVAEAMTKVRVLREMESELRRNVASLTAQLRAATAAERVSVTPSPFVLPPEGPESRGPQSHSHSQSGGANRTDAVIDAALEQADAPGGGPSKPIDAELSDLSLMLSQLETQVRDGLVEAAAQEFAGGDGGAEESIADGDGGLQSASSSRILEF